MSSRPIAILDSGVGGLSVVSAIQRLIPNENIYYFADTAHLPYGTKSPEFIRELAVKLALRAKAISECKILVIACHTISVWCLEEIEKVLKIPVIGMSKPSMDGVKNILSSNAISSFALLCTKATLASGLYRNVFLSMEVQTQYHEYACGPLVSMVEECDLVKEDLIGFLTYFLPPHIKESEALFLGCTHFSALIPYFKEVFRKNVLIIDGADFVARAVLNVLSANKLLNLNVASVLVAYVTDNKERFQKSSQRFMDRELNVRLIDNYRCE